MNFDPTPKFLLESYLPTIHNALKNIADTPDLEIIDWSLKTAYQICHVRNADAMFFLEFHTRLNRWLHDSGYLFPELSLDPPDPDSRPQVFASQSPLPNPDPRPPAPALQSPDPRPPVPALQSPGLNIRVETLSLPNAAKQASELLRQ